MDEIVLKWVTVLSGILTVIVCVSVFFFPDIHERAVLAAEQQKEVDDCLAWSGRRPLQWLYENTEVDQRWCLVHATHAEADEVALMANSGAVVLGLFGLNTKN